MQVPRASIVVENTVSAVLRATDGAHASIERTRVSARARAPRSLGHLDSILPPACLATLRSAMSDNDMPDAALDAAPPSDVEDYTSFAPLEVGQSKSLTGEDEGVVKKLLAEGEGYLQPEKGDEVFGACSESPSASATHSSRACARSALRGHAAGRHHVRQQPRARRAVQVHARHGCVAEAGGRCSRCPPALAPALAHPACWQGP